MIIDPHKWLGEQAIALLVYDCSDTLLEMAELEQQLLADDEAVRRLNRLLLLATYDFFYPDQGAAK